MRTEEATLKAYSYRKGSSQTPAESHMQARRIRPAIPLIKPAQPEKEWRCARKNVQDWSSPAPWSTSFLPSLEHLPESSSLSLKRDAALVNSTCSHLLPFNSARKGREGEKHLRVWAE
ncbi:hypothetical protein PCANC_10471 [Puccinia coronata f. sp. avenae]|uniref:Uncharacterized protein n=1 Tax=Puccinia coronata f. sp. avenae TaxID=200324 RepID=A0A2N5T499_9BASI|nr:hypothetical protein PCASD_19736 [Puccinia coronata f. sp. avenae]PLW33487.1 hypothetical protein PCASD_14407 [Puccinia coronata f. sp. avenae]PLW49728.1 hypothetical protein PCANC_10471 [Puccinia coronata f. sp. avenae]